MEIVGVMMVRNEADILAVNLLHHLAHGVDRFLIVDNGSSDGTRDVLQAFARSDRVRWISDPGSYRQSEITTALAREAKATGADWVIPIDADEFWWAPNATIRQVLARSSAGALRAHVLNFIQRWDQHASSPRALLHITRRAPAPIGPLDRAQHLVQTGQYAYVEMMYQPKWLCRPDREVEIAMGNHGVEHVLGPQQDTSEIICLHAILRSRAILEAKAMDHGQRLRDLKIAPWQGWHVQRWQDIARAGGLDDEWRANSYAGETLIVGGRPHRVVFDPRLRDLVAPWIDHEVIDRRKVVRMSNLPGARTEDGATPADAVALGNASTMRNGSLRPEDTVASSNVTLVSHITSRVSSAGRLLVISRDVPSLLARSVADDCQVTALTPDQAAADQARSLGAAALVIDLNDIPPASEAIGRDFDAVLTDAVSFVVKPEALLLAASDYLHPGGILVAVVPNSAHISVRLALLAGEFPPRDNHLVGPGHLHFFTRASLMTLLVSARFAIHAVDAVEAAVEPHDARFASLVPPEIIMSLVEEEAARATHFIASASPLARPDKDVVAEHIRALVMERDEARHVGTRLLRTTQDQLNGHLRETERLTALLHTSLDELRTESQTRLEEANTVIADLQQQMQARADEANAIIAELQQRMQAQAEEANTVIADLQARMQAQAAILADLQATRASLHTRLWQVIALPIKPGSRRFSAWAPDRLARLRRFFPPPE